MPRLTVSEKRRAANRGGGRLAAGDRWGRRIQASIGCATAEDAPSQSGRGRRAGR